MINKMTWKINENNLDDLKSAKKTSFFVLISWHGKTEHIFFYQRKCTRKKSYLIQHCCSKPPTCIEYWNLGNACCRKAPFCIGRNSIPTFTLLIGMFPSPHILQAHNVFLMACVLILMSTLSNNTSLRYFTKII